MTADSRPTSPPSGTAPSAALVAALLGRAPRLAVALAAGQALWPVARSIHTRVRARTTYTVKVPATDEIYDNLHEWVLGLLPTKEQRALEAWTAKRDTTALDSPSDGPPQPSSRLRLRYDGDREQPVVIGGHKIRVVVYSTHASRENFKPPEIVFTAYSLAAQQRLIAEIAQVARTSQQANRKPSCRMLGRYGWSRHDDLITRDLDSVILPGSQLQRLVTDVDRFLSSESEYVRRCVPWHRAHLYEGPPGTGKTSVARAIASRFGMDVWYLPLADVRRDGELLGVLDQIGPRSMLLLEDIDVFHAATKRDDDNGVTLSGLLNALDGIATPHGLFTVLTTNTPEVLDRAVVRAGRVDLVEHFGMANEDQVHRLLGRWYNEPASDFKGTGVFGISPAEVIEVCKGCDDPAAAVRELRQAAAVAMSFA